MKVYALVLVLLFLPIVSASVQEVRPSVVSPVLAANDLSMGKLTIQSKNPASVSITYFKYTDKPALGLEPLSADSTQSLRFLTTITKPKEIKEVYYDLAGLPLSDCKERQLLESPVDLIKVFGTSDIALLNAKYKDATPYNKTYVVCTWATSEGLINYDTLSKDVYTGEYYSTKLTATGFKRILGSVEIAVVNDVVRWDGYINLSGYVSCFNLTNFFNYAGSNCSILNNSFTSLTYNYSSVIYSKCPLVLLPGTTLNCTDNAPSSGKYGQSVNKTYGMAYIYDSRPSGLSGIYVYNNTKVSLNGFTYIFISNIELQQFSFYPVPSYSNLNISIYINNSAFSTLQNNSDSVGGILALTNATIYNSYFYKTNLGNSITAYLENCFFDRSIIFYPANNTYKNVYVFDVLYAFFGLQDLTIKIQEMKINSQYIYGGLFGTTNLNFTNPIPGSSWLSPGVGFFALWDARVIYTFAYNYTTNRTNQIILNTSCYTNDSVNFPENSDSSVSYYWLKNFTVERNKDSDAYTRVSKILCNHTNGTLFYPLINQEYHLYNTRNDGTDAIVMIYNNSVAVVFGSVNSGPPIDYVSTQTYRGLDPMFLVILGTSLALITLGFIVKDHTEITLIGFVLMFLISMSVMVSGLTYKVGENVTISYEYANESIGQINKTVIESSDTYANDPANTGINRSFGFFMTILSVVGFSAVFYSMRKGRYQ
jgi:hypothetical protein